MRGQAPARPRKTGGGDMRYYSDEAHEAERQKAAGDEAREADGSVDAEESKCGGTTKTRSKDGQGSQ